MISAIRENHLRILPQHPNQHMRSTLPVVDLAQPLTLMAQVKVIQVRAKNSSPRFLTRTYC